MRILGPALNRIASKPAALAERRVFGASLHASVMVPARLRS
ncbi:hypothetical protein GLA29479_3086 [Lysobacter antibioticus]|nr:hypothetical protein GLA29479_3086 [Lysobacter antibioticus]